jgi:hypothetical protein
MNSYLLISGILMVLLGFAHSVLGEWLIFRHRRMKGSVVPSLENLKQRHSGIIWATWHFTTILGWCLGFLIIQISLNQSLLNSDLASWIIHSITVGTLSGSLLVLFATKGKHPGWLVLLIISLLLITGF